VFGRASTPAVAALAAAALVSGFRGRVESILGKCLTKQLLLTV
jgi:hypothetical protein